MCLLINGPIQHVILRVHHCQLVLLVFSQASATVLGMQMLVHHFGPTGNMSTTFGWIAIRLDIRGPQKMNPDDFCDYLTIVLVPP